MATDYAVSNGAAAGDVEVTIAGDYSSVTVTISAPAPVLFLGIFGIAPPTFGSQLDLRRA